MRMPIAFAVSTALVLPTVAAIAPAEATSQVTSGNQSNVCSKTRHGVTVRVKVTMLPGYTRVRVSHPEGRGKFRQPKVASVTSTDGEATHSSASWRTIYSPITVRTVFTLQSGKKIKLACADTNTAVSRPKGD